MKTRLRLALSALHYVWRFYRWPLIIFVVGITFWTCLVTVTVTFFTVGGIQK